MAAPPAFALTVLTVLPRACGKLEADKRGISRPGVSDGLAKDVVPEAKDPALVTANKITKEVYELINSRGAIFLTSSVINGVYAIRIVSANPRAEEQYLRKAFEILVNTAEEILNRVEENNEVMTNDVNGH